MKSGKLPALFLGLAAAASAYQNTDTLPIRRIKDSKKQKQRKRPHTVIAPENRQKHTKPKRRSGFI